MLPADFICIQSSDICLWLSFPSLPRTGIGNGPKLACVHSMLPQGKMAEKEIHTRILEASVSCKKEKKRTEVLHQWEVFRSCVLCRLLVDVVPCEYFLFVQIHAIAAWAKRLTLHSCSIFHLISWGTNSTSSSASNLANDYSNIFLLANQQWQLFNCCQWILCMMDSVSDIQFTWFNLFFHWSIVNFQCYANLFHTTKWLSYTHARARTHTHTHSIFIFFSIVVYPRRLDIVPWALQQDLAVCPSCTQ